MISVCHNSVVLVAVNLVLFHAVLVPTVQGEKAGLPERSHGGIRRRAWGRVHMLRSGKRSDIPPTPEQDLLLPMLTGHAADLDRPTSDLFDEQPGFGGFGGPETGDDDMLRSGDFPPLPLTMVNTFQPEQDGEIKFLEDEGIPSKRGFYQRRPAWGGAHMLRSGKRSATADKRGGLWDGHSRPRWGGAHMLRSGRPDPSMQEMIENMNNGRNTDII